MKIELRRGPLRGTAETMGGELVSLRDGEREYLWGGDPAHWAGRNPVLFPFVGTLKGGEVRFGERVCAMPRHGFARTREFTVEEQGEDFAVLALREDDESLACYPYPFTLRVTHRLTQAGFSTAFSVENPGPGPLSFCIGAHTAFRCPLEAGEEFSDYRLVFDGRETADTLLLTPAGTLLPGQTERLLTDSDTLALDYALFRRLDTVIFSGLRSTGVSLRSGRTGRGVRVEFGGFPLVAFWTRADTRAPFLCIEPWHGCAAAQDEGPDFDFCQKPHCVTLAPGEEKRLAYRVSLTGPDG